MSTPHVHTLYRFFDGDSTLLYVGRTVDARSRFRTHERTKEWFDGVARIEREVFPTAESLATAEVAAIRSEHPLHNIQHAAGRRPRKVPTATADPIDDEFDARAHQRVQALATMWGTEPQMTPCDDEIKNSGCDCIGCVDWIIADIDFERMSREDDRVLCDRLEALEADYVTGAESMDWLYDWDDALMFRRMKLQDHSLTRPAPAVADIRDGVIQIGCPFCLDVHQHYIASGAAIEALPAACAGPGRARYLPVLDPMSALDESAQWLRSVA